MAAKKTNDNDVQSFEFTSNDSVNSILQSQQRRWTPLAGNSITYSFVDEQTAPLYQQQFGSDYQVIPLTPAIQASVNDIFQRVFSSVIDVNFTPKTEVTALNATTGLQETTDYGTIRLMFLPTQAGESILGLGYFPTLFGESDPQNGDLYINQNQAYIPGELGYTTILHELGHVLGLKHPFDTSGKTLPLNEDNNTFTVMTYNDSGSYTGGLPVSLMPYDIQALQHLYGAREKNNDNTTYVFRDVNRYSANGVDYYTFASGNFKSTLWDSGGQDTLDFSAITAFPTSPGKDGFDYRFELKQGGFLTEYSAYDSATYNAYDPNTQQWNLTRPDGSSFQTLDYGTVLAFSPIDNSFDATIENLFGTQQNDYIQGNNVANLIRGNSGNDKIEGLEGCDTVFGGKGNDWIVGGAGNDILTGGNGIDSFVYNSVTDAGDMIKDFTVGSDKIVLTEIVNSSGFRGFNPLNDGFFSFQQGSSMTTMLIDPDGRAGNSFKPAPFILFKNVSATALNCCSNFVLQ